MIGSGFPSNCQQLLPITLTSFTARPTPQHHSLLEWETSSEQNNERFEIERSYDGRTFEVIGSVPGAGTTEVAQRYTFTDRAPLPGANYYRLRQVDYDGAFSYSEVRHVAHEAPLSQWQLAPVPARDYVQLLTSGEGPAGPAELFDMLGRLRLQHYLQPADNGRLDLRGLPAGQYVLRYRNTVKRLVKVD